MDCTHESGSSTLSMIQAKHGGQSTAGVVTRSRIHVEARSLSLGFRHNVQRSDVKKPCFQDPNV